MKLNLHQALAAVVIGFISAASADEHLPTTLMTTRGKLMVSEDFDKPLAPVTGKPVGFASGFTGWRYNDGTPGAGKSIKSGMWKLADGTFKGIENPDAHHPATASFGIQYKDVIIQCDVRLDDVPANGRASRSLFVKATDEKDYVCALNVGTGGLNALVYDDARINPTTKQREKFPALRAPLPVKLNEWHTAVLEIKGDEIVASLDDKSVTLSNPLIAADKHSVMLGASTEASFRHFRIWEALPNPDWPKNKQALTSAK
ncbi:MAG: hypothetical protein ABI318_11695 [Chthoniobacteraceae bacterium]